MLVGEKYAEVETALDVRCAESVVVMRKGGEVEGGAGAEWFGHRAAGVAASIELIK